MKLLSTLLVLFVAIEHFYIAWLEMTQIPSEKAAELFNMPYELMEQKRVQTLFSNQGLYNGFLAIGLVWARFAAPDNAVYGAPSCSSASSSSPPHGARFHPATKAFCSNKACRHFWPPQPSLPLKHTPAILSLKLTERMAASTDFSKRFTTTIQSRTPNIHDHSHHAEQSPIPHCRNL